MDCVCLGNRIKERRLDNNLTQKQLGELVHVSDKAVSKWERGICYPDISLIE
ncbi:MAG: helix-turn-helix transcriptional regulator [Pseudobutyrivibrio sp.]|nr:helix-turn-helix transcriptional regulator [Pseudobutyrivibrio sp.]